MRGEKGSGEDTRNCIRFHMTLMPATHRHLKGIAAVGGYRSISEMLEILAGAYVKQFLHSDKWKAKLKEYEEYMAELASYRTDDTEEEIEQAAAEILKRRGR